MEFKEGHICFGKIKVMLTLHVEGDTFSRLYYDYKKMVDEFISLKKQGMKVQSNISRSLRPRETEEIEKECRDFLDEVSEYCDTHMSNKA